MRIYRTQTGRISINVTQEEAELIMGICDTAADAHANADAEYRVVHQAEANLARLIDRGLRDLST